MDQVSLHALARLICDNSTFLGFGARAKVSAGHGDINRLNPPAGTDLDLDVEIELVRSSPDLCPFFSIGSILANDFRILSSIERLRWRLPRKAGMPRCQRLTRRLSARFMLVWVSSGGTGRNSPWVAQGRRLPASPAVPKFVRKLRPCGPRGGNPLRQYLPARPGDGRLPRLRAHACRDRKLGKHERCRAPRCHGGAAGPHGASRGGERLIA